jgi:transcriptional regulator with XRE-family HTH domain
LTEPATDNEPIDEAVGAALRQLRIGRKVSMAALARHLGVSYQQIQKYERGDNRMVASTLFRIAGFFGIDVGDLFALLNAEGERAKTDRLLVLAAPRDAMRRAAPEAELAAVMTNYSKISDENVRDGVGQLIERLAAASGSGRGSVDGAGDEPDAP